MKTTLFLLTLILMLLPLSGKAGTPLNTEGNASGILTIEEMLVNKSAAGLDKRLLKEEKKQLRAEKRIVKLSNLLQKKIAKHNSSGASGTNTMSLLSMIGGIGGFLFIFIPYVGILGLLMAIAGFVLGLVAMKKEGSNVMNILGVVFGGLTIFLFLIAVIIVASWLAAI